MVLTDNSNHTGRSNSTVQITRRFKKLRKAQRKKALEHAASISTATFRRTSSHIASGYPDDHSLAVSRIAPVNGGASVRSSRSSNVEGDDVSIATAKKDNTNHCPLQDANCDSSSIATPQCDNKGNASSSCSLPFTKAPLTGVAGNERGRANTYDWAEMEIPPSPSGVSIKTTRTMAEADARMSNVFIEIPTIVKGTACASSFKQPPPTTVEGPIGDDGQPFEPTVSSIASSKGTQQTESTVTSTPSLNSYACGKTAAKSLATASTQLTGSICTDSKDSLQDTSKGTPAARQTSDARSRATISTRRTIQSAATTSTVKSFHSLAGRGGRKALRAAKHANIRPGMAMPSSMPEAPSSSSVYKAAGDDMTLKTVDDGATVRTSFTRRSTKSAVTTATVRSFYSLSARSGRKAVTAARLASKADITSPLDLPSNPNRGDRSTKKVTSDDATVSMFDEYFSMEGGDEYDEEEGSPRGCLIVCSSDNSDWHDDKTIDTEDILDEGAWDDYEWHELPSHVRDAACLLGCTSSKAWNCGGVAYNNDKSWSELSSAQIRAARVLGFNQRLWDHEAIERTKMQQVIRGLDTYREVVQCNEETKMITGIALPATWETMLELITEAIQIALISKYLGQDALDAYAIVEGCLFVAYNIGSGLTDAEEILVCQALGMEDTFLAGQYTLLSIATYIISAAPVYLCLIFFIEAIIIGLGLNAEVATMAMLYIPVLTLSHFISDSFADTLSSLLRCDGKYLEMAIIDSIFNVSHIMMIAAGVVFFDVGLVGMAWIEVVNAVMYGVFIFAYSSAKGWLQPFWGGLTDVRVLLSLKSIKNMMVLAFPLALNEFISSGEWSILSLFAAYIGGIDLNAWTILGSLWGLFSYAPEGINSAVVMRLAFHLGRGDPRSAKVTGYKCLAYCGGLSLVVSAMFYIWHKEIIALFTNSPLIAASLGKTVVLIAVGNVIVGLGGTASVILTAQGRPGIATWANGISVWAISIPLSALFTFGLKYNITGLVCSMLTAYTTSSLIMLAFVFTTNWAKASMEVIAAEAEEEGSFGGDDASTISQLSLALKDDPGIRPSCDATNDEKDPSTVVALYTTSSDCAPIGSRAFAIPSSSACTFLSRKPDCSSLPCCSYVTDEISMSGMETIMSPSGLFTIVENNEERFRQWVGTQSSVKSVSSRGKKVRVIREKKGMNKKKFSATDV